MTEKFEIAVLSRRGLPQPKAWIGAMLLALTACAGVPEQTAASLDKQEVVTRMAQSRWDALRKGDFETAYKLMSPASRSIVTLEDFQRKSSIATWKAADVKKVECPADDLCTAWVHTRYAVKMRSIGRTVENDQEFTETWRNVAGGWWYVLSDAR